MIFNKNKKQSKSIKNVIRSIDSVILIIFLIIIWSLITTVEQTVDLRGQITPHDGIASIRHSVGGIVETINVQNYNPVKTGELLATLDDRQSKSSLTQYESKLKVIDAQIYNIATYLKGNIDQTKNLNNIPDTIENSEQLILAEKTIADIDQDNLKIKIQENEIKQEEFEKRNGILKKQVSDLEEQKNISNKLLAVKAISKTEALEHELKYTNALSEYQKSQSESDQNIKELNEFKNKAILLKQTVMQEKYQKLIDLNKDKIDVVTAIFQFKTNLNNLEIRSPISGIVQGIKIVNGMTIQPGEEILSIIPEDGKIVFEAKIPLAEKGKLLNNLPVEIQFDGFNVMYYNRIKGKIINISPYIFNDDQTHLDYFKAIISMDQKSLQSGSTVFALQAGMSGTAYVQTGEQSLFAYLAEPLYRGISHAFSAD
jgi:HlyD family type I secretion membrane fusion protein